MQASTDEIDLLGIAKLLINRRGSTAGGEPGAERALRTITRHRKAQVSLCTAIGNRIHQGIGITLAAGVTAEIGAPASQPSTRRLSSYAGIIPRVKQTGGPKKVSKKSVKKSVSPIICVFFACRTGAFLEEST